MTLASPTPTQPGCPGMSHNARETPPKVDEELVRQINDALFQSGERERLKSLVKAKLQAAGWFDRIRAEADSTASA